MPNLPSEIDALFQEYFDYMCDENERPHKTLSEVDILSIHVVFLKLQSKLNKHFSEEKDPKEFVEDIKMKMTGTERKLWDKWDKEKEEKAWSELTLDGVGELGPYDFKCRTGNIYRCKTQEEKDKMSAEVCDMLDND